MIIFRAELDDEADYQCLNKNDFGVASTECELLVEEENSVPFFKQKAESQTISEGQSVTFSVIVAGNPPPEVNWLKDGEVIEDNERFVIKEDVEHGKFSLILEQTAFKDAGTYKCVAFNEAGEASCKTSLVMIPSSGEIEPVVEDALRAEVEMPFEFEINSVVFEPVNVTGEPQPILKTAEPEIAKYKPERNSISAAREGPTFELTTTKQERQVPQFIALPEGCSPFDVNPDGDVKLQVRVSGRPLPEVNWFKNDEPLQVSDSLTLHSDGDRHTLSIQGPTPKDKGVYKCVASNDAGTATRSFDVNIEGNPDWVMPSFQDHLASAFQISDDGDVTMEVKVAGNPFPEIEWTRDGEPIKESDRIHVLRKIDDIYSLVIRGAGPKDEGEYTCTATNSAGKTMRTFTLNVDDTTSKHVAPVEEAVAPPRVMELPERRASFHISYEGDVKLQVKFSGEPEIEWSKDGKPVHNSSHIQLQSKEGVHTLLIKGATPDDKGLYKCTATNKAGMAWKTFTVEFEGKGEKPVKVGSELKRPAFVEDKSVVPFEITKEGDVQLKARVEGKPHPEVEWDKDDVPLQESERIIITSKDDMHMLLIKRPTIDDKGTYKLTATNEAGVGTRAFNVEIAGSSAISLLLFF